jgi:hypothetical protein
MNLHEIAILRAMVESGQFRDDEAFAKAAIEIYRNGFGPALQERLSRMGFPAEAQRVADRRQNAADPHRTWVNHLLKKYNLVLRKPDPDRNQEVRVLRPTRMRSMVPYYDPAWGGCAP